MVEYTSFLPLATISYEILTQITVKSKKMKQSNSGTLSFDIIFKDIWKFHKFGFFC